MSTSITSTTATGSNPAITSKQVIAFREANLGFSGAVSSTYRDEAGNGTTIRWTPINLLNSGTARAKTEGNSGNDITFDVNTETAITLTINQYFYQAFELEEFEANMTVVDLMNEYAKAAAYAVNLKIDLTLGTLVSGWSTVFGTLTVDLTDDDVRAGDQALNDANAPADGRFFGISPKTKNSMLSIDRYASSDFNRGGGVNIIKGTFGEIYNLQSFVSTNIKGSNSAGHDNGIWQRDAIALAMRMKPKTRTFDDILNQSTQHSVASIWGVVETRDDHGVYMKGG